MFGCWLGYQFNFIHQRQALRKSIEQRGGRIDVFTRPDPIEIVPGLFWTSYGRVQGPEEEPEIPRWRRWFGDESINQVMLPVDSSESDVAQAKRIFPESAVEVIMQTSGGGMF